MCTKHPESKTYLEKTRLGKQIERCSKCRSERVSKSRVKQIQKLKNYFGGKCINCGYNKYLQALDFHHKDPTQKKFGLSDNRSGRSLKKMIEEAQKCILVCCRCHREIHIEMEK
jgi:hypothetical protein